MYPKTFLELIAQFKKLPGVGQKSAERYAYAALDMDINEIQEFAQTLLDSKNSIKYCQKCFNMCDDDICDICKDDHRDRSTLVVVESTKDLISMEKIEEYKGLYHVLGGVISTSKGVMPDDLNIDSLLERLNGEIKEVIIATNANKDGEITALYLSKLLRANGVLVTRLAHGLPMGALLDYADEITLKKAIDNRKIIES